MNFLFISYFYFVSEQDSYDLDLEDAIQPPPISISAPDLAILEYRFEPHFPLRRSVSSTELLYERAMARFYEAVELEEAEKSRKLKISQDKLATPSNIAPTNLRKRLGSMTEAERLSFEKRSEMRRQSADMHIDLKAMHRWNSKENIGDFKSMSHKPAKLLSQRMESQESEELSDDYHVVSVSQQGDSFDLGSDYTESTASSDQDSIEKFKIELMARSTRSPTPKELETYHPRNMSAGVFTPYRPPSPDQAASVLCSPAPLPSPDFVPKPILKRSSKENVLLTENPGSSLSINPNGNPGNSNGKSDNDKTAAGKLDLAKGIKSFFQRDKKSATEKNTEENEFITNPQESTNAALIAADKEAKLKAKQEEENRLKREAERVMMEEARAAADHYSELVSHVTKTRKYHTPIYMDQEELKKIAEKAAKEDPLDEDLPAAESGLIPPVSNKPRLSISERGQLMHVREEGSKSAVKHNVSANCLPDSSSEDASAQSPVLEKKQFSPPATPVAPPQSDNGSALAAAQAYLSTTSQKPSPPKEIPTKPTADDEDMIITTTVVSETVEERPDARGRPRLVKVKRIIKRRIPSSTRSRDTSLSRPPSSLDQGLPENPTTIIAQRSISKTRKPVNRMETKTSAPPISRLPMPSANTTPPATPATDLVLTSSQEMLAAYSNASRSGSSSPTPSISDEEAQEKVRSALSYSTDMVLFVVACYVYLFKDARLVLPILALMIYRQLGEAISNCIPNWLRRKKPEE